MQFLALEVLRNTPAVTTLSCLFFYVFLVMCACCSWRTGLAAKASGERSEFPPAFDVVRPPPLCYKIRTILFGETARLGTGTLVFTKYLVYGRCASDHRS